MDKKIKQNVPLIIGLAIPVVMILFIAAAIYFPRVFSTVEPPKYDFLYMVRRGYGDIQYWVSNGKLIKQKIERSNKSTYSGPFEVKFYVYDIRKNRSREITFEEAEKFTLEHRPRSPDGFVIVSGRRSGGLFPFSAAWDYRTRYLKKDGYTEKLNLEDDSYGFQFLGWIVG